MKQAALAAAVIVTLGLGLAALGSRDRGGVGAASPVSTSPTLPSTRVTFPAGWNIMDEGVAAQLTIQLSNESAYTFAAGDSAYRMVVFDSNHPPAFKPISPGYWVFLPTTMQATIPAVGPMESALHINPRWTMVASEAGTPLRIVGADLVLLYDPVMADYQVTDQRIDPGRGRGSTPRRARVSRLHRSMNSIVVATRSMIRPSRNAS